MVYRGSFSQCNMFSHYPRQWFYQYILKIPSIQDFCYANAGSAVHHCLDKWYKKEITDIVQLKEMFNKEWLTYKLEVSKISQKQDEYWGMILNSREHNISATSTELKIYFEDALAYLDIVDTNEDIISDHKTSTRSPENEEEYKHQVMFYSWMYFRKFNRLPKVCRIYYLKYPGSKGLMEFSFTQEDIDYISKWYNDCLKGIEETIAINKIPGRCKTCNFFCPYTEICNKQNEQFNVTLTIQGSYIHINSMLPEIVNKQLHKKFSYDLKNSYFIKKHYPMANTHIYFYNDHKHTLPLGFYNALLKTLNDYAEYKKITLNLKINDYRIFNTDKINMPEKFINNRELRYYQKEAVDKVLENKIALFEIATGGGKCFGKGTKILMYDFSIKEVQDIKIGDKLMGDNGTVRNVLSLSQGKEQMYKVNQKLAESYIVNESHILSLRSTQSHLSKKYLEKIDIKIKDYINMKKKIKSIYKGYKNTINLSEKEILIEPYFLGVWLGDGSSGGPAITNIDKEVINYLYDYANRLDMKISIYKYNNHCADYAFINKIIKGNNKNKLKEYLKHYNLLKNKHIPEVYIKNSRKVRLELLAGMIDTDGYVAMHRSAEIVQKDKKIIEQLYFLANSLGFYCKIKSYIGRGKVAKGNMYHLLTIRGNLSEIPTKIKRKQLKDAFYPIRYHGTKITIENLGIDNYYGFTIDGNKRFLLSDFTVVHNTECAIEAIRQLGYKTLFVVDKRELMNQTIDRIKNSLGIEVGMLGQSQRDIKHITVATIQTLIRGIKSKDKEILNYLSSIRVCIIDECHHIASASFLTLSKYLTNCEYRIGMSGTAFRTDGDDMKIYSVVGNIIYTKNAKDLINEAFLMAPNIIFIKDYMDETEVKLIEETCRTGLINEEDKYPEFYNKFIVNNIKRNEIIRKIIELKNNKKILVLVKLVEHGQILEQLIPNSKYLFGETNKEERKELFEKFKNGELKCLISTIGIFSEGIDLPDLEEIMNVSANRSDVKTIQVLGRVLRKNLDKNQPNYIDFIDYSGMLKFASISRRKALLKQGHFVEVLHKDDYFEMIK